MNLIHLQLFIHMNLAFYIHHCIHINPGPDPDFSQKLKSGSESEKYSRTPGPAPNRISPSVIAFSISPSLVRRRLSLTQEGLSRVILVGEGPGDGINV